MKQQPARIRFTLLIAAFAGSAAMNYFAMGLLDVCEAQLEPQKALVPLGFAIGVCLYVSLRSGEAKYALSASCALGTVFGAVIGRFAPWICF